ncbi:MAG TPA: Ig-like domain-containing protein, partial [Symbiobacteriaceae bacterium]|nr:Ig-like domain-containing protein [Symbiobacteriaceae bacterium]
KADTSGVATVTVTLSDNGGVANGGVDTSAAQTFTITVTAVNDAPSFTAGSNQTVAEDAAAQSVAGWATGISAGPADESAQTVTFQVSTNNNPLFETLPALAADGTLTYKPAANAAGTATVTVRLQDNGGGADTSAAQTFTIEVTPVNDAPALTGLPGAQTVAEDTNLKIPTFTVSDLDIGAGTFLVNLSVAHGRLTFGSTTGLTFTAGVNGQAAIAVTGTQTAINTALADLTYRPDQDYHGADTLTLSVSDQGNTGTGGALSLNDTVALTVTPVNDAPTFTVGAGETVLEDSGAHTVTSWATSISAGPADEAGQTLTFAVSTTNNSLFASLPTVAADGTLTYELAANAYGQATVTVTLSDDGGGTNTSAPATFTIDVTPVNDVPGFTKGADQTVLEDAAAQTVTGWATAISAGPANESAQTLTFTVTTNNDGLFAALPSVAANGTLTFTPKANANGTATVTVVLKDNGGTAGGGVDTTAAQTFTISVTAVNDAPSFTKGADISVTEDSGAQSVAGWATAISAGQPDEAGQTLTFTVSNTNTGLFDVQPALSAGGTLTYTLKADAYGSATVTVTLSDNGGTAGGGTDASAAQTFTLEVRPVNDAPSFTMGSDQTVLEDAGAQSVTGWATGISVGPVNEASQVPTFTLTTSDDSLFAVLPAVAANGMLTYTPKANANGWADVTVTLSDGGGTTDNGIAATVPQTFRITVTAVNDVPVFTKGANQTVLEDAGAQSVTGWATGISAGQPNESGQTLTFAVSTTNAGLFAVAPALAANGTLTYTPAANANGSATVTVTLSDDGGVANGGVDSAADQSFTITVTAVNDAPSFTAGANQTVLEDAAAQSVTGWATNISTGPADEAGQTHSFTVSTNNNGLFAVLPAVAADGALTYTLAPNAYGTATVTVTLSDNGGTANSGADTSAAATFTIAATAVNDVPAFTKGADQTVAEDVGAQSVTGWATGISAGPANESAQSLTFTVTTNNDSLFSSLPAVAASGTLTYTPALNAYGTATVTVVLADDGGTAGGGVDTTPAQTFVVSVTAVNDRPAFTAAGSNVSQNIIEGQGLTALAATDVEGTTLVFSLTAGTLPDGISLNTDGTFAGTASYTSLGNYSVTITVSDGDLTNATTLAIAVAEGDTTPTLAPVANRTYNEGDQVSIQVTGADSDGDGLTYSAAGLPGGVSIHPVSGLISGGLGYATAGTHTVTVTVTDSTPTAGNSAADRTSQTFTLTVVDVNQAPNLTGPTSITAAEGESLPGLQGVDPDGGTVTFSMAGGTLPQGIRLNSDGSFSGKVGYQAAGSYSVTVRVSDAQGAAAQGPVAITITNTDTLPALAPVADRTGTAGNEASLTLSGADEDGDGLTYSAAGLPDGLRLDSKTGVISGKLGPKSDGVHQITVTVTDSTPGGPRGDSASQTFTWTVSAHKGPKPIRGRVTDAETGLAVKGAEVRLKSQIQSGAAGTSDENGRFVTGEVAPGAYTVLVSAYGYKPFEGEVTVSESAEVDLAVSLTPHRVVISGTVSEKAIGLHLTQGKAVLVPGVKLRLMWADTELNREHGRQPGTEVSQPAGPQWTDDTGRYAWTVMIDGDYYLLAEKEGYLLYDSRSRGEQGTLRVRLTDVSHDVELLKVSGEHTKYIGGYPDGTFRPDQPLTRAEAAVVFTRLLGRPSRGRIPAFTDVGEHWAAGAIAEANELGLMNGDGNGTFRPDDQLTRAEIAAVIGRLAKLQPMPGSAFADTNGHWAEALARAVQLAGLMQGLPDGTFRPDQPVTRAEFVTVINRVLGRKPGNLESASFPDVPASHWAYLQIEEAATDHRYVFEADGTEQHVK